MGYITAQRFEIERSKGFPVSISLQTKATRKYVRIPGTVKYPPSCGKSSGSWSESRCAQGGLGYSFSFKVKLGYISTKQLESERSKVFLCPFHCKPRQSGVSLEYAEVENIPPVPGNRAQVGQNHDARKAVSATLSVLK